MTHEEFLKFAEIIARQAARGFSEQETAARESYVLDKLYMAFETGAKTWMDQYDALKAKYEPSVAVISEALSAQQKEPSEWHYCPECGDDDNQRDLNTHFQCELCKQEWFSDVDYSDTVKSNLNRLANTPKPPEMPTREEFVNWMLHNWMTVEFPVSVDVIAGRGYDWLCEHIKGRL